MTDTNNIYAAGSSNLTIQSAGSVGTLSAPNGSVNIGTNVDGTVTAGTLTSDTLTITEDVNGTNYLSIESGTSYTSFNNNSGNVIAINHSGKVAINSYNFVAPLYVGGSDAGSGRGDAQYFGKGTGTSFVTAPPHHNLRPATVAPAHPPLHHTEAWSNRALMKYPSMNSEDAHTGG